VTGQYVILGATRGDCQLIARRLGIASYIPVYEQVSDSRLKGIRPSAIIATDGFRRLDRRVHRWPGRLMEGDLGVLRAIGTPLLEVR
jgi:hypothetical protein